MFMASPLFSSSQDPGGSKDPQTGGAGTGSLCQRHRPGADRGQALQPRGEHTEGNQLGVKSHIHLYCLSKHCTLKFLKFN